VCVLFIKNRVITSDILLRNAKELVVWSAGFNWSSPAHTQSMDFTSVCSLLDERTPVDLTLDTSGRDEIGTPQRPHCFPHPQGTGSTVVIVPCGGSVAFLDVDRVLAESVGRGREEDRTPERVNTQNGILMTIRGRDCRGADALLPSRCPALALDEWAERSSEDDWERPTPPDASADDDWKPQEDDFLAALCENGRNAISLHRVHADFSASRPVFDVKGIHIPAAGEEPGRPEGHMDFPQDVCFAGVESDKPLLVVAGGPRNTVHIFDLVARQCVQNLGVSAWTWGVCEHPETGTIIGLHNEGLDSWDLAKSEEQELSKRQISHKGDEHWHAGTGTQYNGGVVAAQGALILCDANASAIWVCDAAHVREGSASEFQPRKFLELFQHGSPSMARGCAIDVEHNRLIFACDQATIRVYQGVALVKSARKR
jgi:hypothetical protein